MTEPLPDDRSRIRAIAIGVAATVAVAGVIAVIVVSQLKPVEERPVRKTFEPAEETVEATLPVPAVAALASAGPDAAGTATGTSESAKALGDVGEEVAAGDAPADEAPYAVAFRLGASLHVALSDGTGAKAVAPGTASAYSLSPDGETLAVVDGGVLALIDTRTCAQRTVRMAKDATPAWLPDSSAVLFTCGGDTVEGHESREVWRVRRDGSGAKKLAQGSAAAVSPDGSLIVVRPDSTDETGALLVSKDGGRFREARDLGTVSALAAGDKRIYASVLDASGGAVVLSCAQDGSSPKRMLGRPDVGVEAVWGSLMVSPDDKRLAAAALGDDGFSRLVIVKLSDGSVEEVSSRRDCYPVRWSADGKRLFYVEGSSIQGESTTLASVKYDGTQRRAVVTGATR